MKHLIPGWVHNPGVHCASTVISDVMTFHGHALDEAMCFGLGCGLGFFYLQADLLNPTSMTAVRSRMLEPRFFENIGRPFKWAQEPDPDRSLAAVKQKLDADLPVLIHADIAHLPHYNTTTHFPGHVIALWGYDDERAAALVADTGWKELIEVPYPDLQRARHDGLPYMKNSGDYYAVPAGGSIPDLRPIIKKALIRQAEDMEGLKIDMPGLFGFPAMRKAVEDLPRWGQAKDWQWCARWFYQVIERRGTGGGAFRLLYSRFLEQAGELEPGLRRAAPAEEMKEIAGDWTDLAKTLKQISELEKPGHFDAAAVKLWRITEKEEGFFRRILGAIEPADPL